MASPVYSDPAIDDTISNKPNQKYTTNGITPKQQQAMQKLVDDSTKNLNTEILALKHTIATIENENPHKKYGWLIDGLFKFVGEIFGFIALALVFTFFFKKELIHTTNNGLTSIGVILADTFSTRVVPLLSEVKNAAIEAINNDKPFLYMTPNKIEAPKLIEEAIQNIESIKKKGQHALAETKFLELLTNNPKEFKIIDSLFLLYSDPHFCSAGADKPVQFLLSRETDFQNEPRFYYLLALGYSSLKSKGFPQSVLLQKAITAVGKCIEIEPNNPRWLSLRGLIHQTFNNLRLAIEDTELALAMAEKQQDNANIARAKNNLAFYYAEGGEINKKEIALKYAKEAHKFDEELGVDPNNSLNTLGYVLMKFAETKQELTEAVECLQKASLGDPTDTDLQAHLIEAQRRLTAFIEI